MLTEDQVQHFHTFGFLVLHDVLTAAELETIASEYATGLKMAQSQTERQGIRRQFNWSNLGPETPFLCTLLEDPRILQPAEQLHGEVIGQFARANSFAGDRTEWHPDTANLAQHIVKFALYLEPLTRDTGAIRFIPGSHRDPLHSAIREVRLKETNEGVVDKEGLDIDEMPAFAAESLPGDFVVFDSRLWHASWGGREGRRMCSFQYFAVPETPEATAAVRAMVNVEARLAKTFPLIRRPDHWATNPEGSTVRRGWIEFLREWGFVGVAHAEES